MARRRVFMSAGELSGDIVGARLVAELKRRDPGIHVFGTGGRRMAAAGADIDVDTNDIGVVGVTEALATLPSVATAYRRIARRVAACRPDVAVLIGNDVFNVWLARSLRRRHIPTLSYFPPQVWVWRSLAGFIARSFDAIVTSFPDEHAVYARADARAAVSFVGHYLANDIQAATLQDRAEARDRLGLPASATVVGVLPGSRQNELAALAPVMLDAVAELQRRDRERQGAGSSASSTCMRVVIAAAETVTPDAIRDLIASRPTDVPIAVTTDSHAVMKSADLLLVASGTASLEAALFGTPMVIAYKVSAITHACVRLAIRLGLIDSYRVGLPNLVLGHAAIPEALQSRATGSVIADEAWTLLSDPPRLSAMREALGGVAERLRGSHALGDAADAVLEWADGRRARVDRAERSAAPAARALSLPKPE